MRSDPSRPDPTRLRVDRLLVAERPIASLLGYERAAQRGPWLLAERPIASPLGYERAAQRGPWLLAALVTRPCRRVTSLPWTKVDAVGHDIRLHP